MTDRDALAKFSLNVRRVYTGIALSAALLLPLGACGKKPNQVDPPPGAEDSAFPRTYPDLSIDPKQ